MRIGLYFGSFNPVHKGHIAIAKYMLKEARLDRVWMVVSPRNPLKDEAVLAPARKRFLQVQKTLKKYPRIRACDSELKLPVPSYTIRTLGFLKKKYPGHEFLLIMGSDSLKGFRKWKDYQKILEQYHLLVYPRKGSKGGTLSRHPNVNVMKAPLQNISSTYIRAQAGKGKDVSKLIP